MEQQVINGLRELKLLGMVETYKCQLSDPAAQSLSLEERLELLIDSEIARRAQMRTQRLLKMAKLKHPFACVEDIDYQKSRGLDKKLISTLAQCCFIERKHNAILTGETGTGKTFLGCAIGQQAIRKGFSVMFFRLTQLAEQIERVRADGTLPKFRTKLSKIKLLIIDDFALARISPVGQQDLFEVIEDRNGSGSILITSQFPTSEWHDCFADATIADATLDRLVNSSYMLELHGGTMRKFFGNVEDLK